MPRDEYQRIELPVRVGREAPELAVLRIGAGEHARAVGLGLDSLRRREVTAGDLTWLFRNLPRSAFVESAAPPQPRRVVYRIVLAIRGPELAEIDWEELLRGTAGELKPAALAGPITWAIVRTCPVRPRASSLPLTLPLRILQLNARANHPIAQWVSRLFGSRPPWEVNRAVVVHSTPGWRPPADWATVSALHVDTLGTLRDPELALATAKPELPGTLGWLARWTERWQTRLVVIHCDTEDEAAVARRLAAALCDRGGPAVLVAAGLETPNFYRDFYDRLIHDFALDEIIVETQGSDLTAALFAGAGREDGLRVSNVGVALVGLSQKLKVEPGLPELQGYRTLFGPELEDQARYVLQAVEDDWGKSRFNLHEREGLLPLSAHLDKMRGIRQELGAPSPPAAPAPEPAARFVNSSLWSDATGEFAMIPQDSVGLTPGRLVHLGIQIGPKDVRIQTLDTAAIIEEVFKWSPELKGVWVEVGLVGIDFEVTGDPVQELWLPREGASEPLYFAICPRRRGVAQLRFGLYYKNNLVQSFRLAAWIVTDDDAEVPAREDREEMARALSVSPSRVGKACYLARMEYSRTSELSAIEGTGERTLTVLANRLDGREILTVKGAEVFATAEVLPDADVPNIITQVRKALDEIAFLKVTGLAEPQYRFLGSPSEVEARCKEAISKLAGAGWNLFTNLAPSEEVRKKVNSLLEGEGKTIHVAHLLREKVIPWAFVYDRAYDEHARHLKGQAVEQGVCLAAIPEQGEVGEGPGPPRPCQFQALTCGEHADCLLNDKRQAERSQQGLPPYDERTVACPLRFWGFRHILEVPPQQIEDDDVGARDERRTITPNGSLQLAAGLNADLNLCKKHWQELSQVAVWIDPQYDRDEILDLLRTKEPDLIYFYCHARGGQMDQDRTNPPYLEFHPDSASRIRPQDFAADPAWSHGPLVFLNACGTLGYSPDALSPFLKALVDGRKASGVLGTEVPVAEALAGEFSREFITRFVGGARAGQALLDARRVLLARKNPLGLVYTLFAPAGLIIELAGLGSAALADSAPPKLTPGPRVANPRG